jgi:hypothetical protein
MTLHIIYDVSVNDLLNELEKLGVNVRELRKLHAAGMGTESLKKNLMQLYHAHLMQRSFKDGFRPSARDLKPAQAN